ncbi:MAG: RNA polymerase sigma factor [Bacillota bacterium]
MSDLEIKLIKKASNGDIKAFEQLIKKYQKYAYNISLKYMKDTQDAQDVTQDALIKIYKNLNNFNMNSKFSTWLYRIVVNTSKDALKKRNKKQDEIDIDSEYENSRLQDLKYEPLKEMENKVLKKKLEDAIDILDLKYREVIILCDQKDFSYEEISKILDIPIGTVRSRISRGRKKLRKIINKSEII